MYDIQTWPREKHHADGGGGGGLVVMSSAMVVYAWLLRTGLNR
jgi:hypothetical protein